MNPMKQLVVRAPRIIVTAAAVTLLAGIAVRWGDGPALAMMLGYLGWLAVEAPLALRGEVALRDVRTILPYGAARVLTIGCAVLAPSAWEGWSPWLLVPAALFVGGVTLREIAIRTLGRFYSHHVVRRADQVAVTGGPYRWIRHPAYAGMLLAHVGFVGFFFNAGSVAGLLVLCAAVVWRLRVEEQVLWDMPGYRDYALGRRRLLPGVW